MEATMSKTPLSMRVVRNPLRMAGRTPRRATARVMVDVRRVCEVVCWLGTVWRVVRCAMRGSSRSVLAGSRGVADERVCAVWAYVGQSKECRGSSTVRFKPVKQQQVVCEEDEVGQTSRTRQDASCTRTR